MLLFARKKDRNEFIAAFADLTADLLKARLVAELG